MLLAGDCLERLKELPDCSVDSIVTDPPYHLVSIVRRFGSENAAPALSAAERRFAKTGGADRQPGTDQYGRLSRGFMGKTWDGGDIAFRVELWAEVFRVLKPGGHVLAFSGTRTYHRMACAIEDAGFEIRDMVQWLYGSGFPKSHNVGKILPEWEGWGTALKPALEPICLGRKPLIGTVAENVLAHRTGAINIDGCRVPLAGEANPSVERRKGAINHLSDKPAAETEAEGKLKSRQTPEAYRAERPGELIGRHPANVVHDGSPEVVGCFPAEAGAAAPVRGTEASAPTAGIYGERGRVAGAFHADSGSAARFFYSAKADADDRLGSKHPTVKPVDLMRWLVRLVTPPNGTVLDPFAGTGTTGHAALLEGFNAILIEREEEYRADIARRMSLVYAGPTERSHAIVKAKGEAEEHDALPLFGAKQ